MHSWAKRGLQTALVTGGLLMLGTGIASADENVNPDTPASPLDLNVTVPVDTTNNAIGTPLGQVDVPGYKGEVSTKDVTGPVKDALATAKSPGGAADSLGGGVPAALPDTDASRQLEGDVSDGGLEPTSDVLKGNKVVGDVVVPIQIVDNAVGVIGDAKVEGGDHSQNYSHNQDVATSGEGSGIAGNAVVLDWALPVQIAGNAGGLAGGSGRVKGGTASQNAAETGDVTTNGRGSSVSGNVVAGQFATPVQVTGNAVSWILGNANSTGYESGSSATSGGWVKTAGDGSALGGNAGAVPIALPVKVNGNGASAWGSNAHADSTSTADAKAGDKTPGFHGTPAYVQTSGDHSAVAGTVLAPQTADVANVSQVAGTWIGNASTGKLDQDERQAGGNASGSNVDAGGFVQSTGQGGAGSANVVDPAVAAPVEATCIGGSHIGNASAAGCTNTVNANAGNGSHTTGNDSTLTGNVVNTQDAAAPEVYGVGGSFIGQGSAAATETKNVTAGAYDGSTGNNSSGSGNIVQVPTSLPTEVPGVGGAFIGQGSGSANEVKTVSGGGGGNTADDNGFLSSNLGTVPVSLPVQAFGIGGTFIGQGHGKSSGDTTSNAGGDVHATGNKGAGAGNLIQAPVSMPTQAHGIGGALGGIGTGDGTNLTDSTAGGKGTANGKDGAVAGNIIQAPVGGAASVPGHGVAAAGIGHGTSVNDVMSGAGGSSATNGDGGALAGNIIGAQALPIVPAANDAVSGAGGLAGGEGTNTTAANSGGDVATSGVAGSLSGNLLDIPAAADPKAFGDAVSAVGAVSKSQADNQTTGQVGGEGTTDGDGSALSGFNFHQDPILVIVPADSLEVPVLAAAHSDSTDMTAINEAPENAAFAEPTGSELGVKDLPALPFAMPSLASLPLGASVPALPALPATSALPAVPALSALPMASALPAVPALPVTSALPAVPALPTAGLPAVSALPTAGLPSLPTAGLPTLPAVPSLNGAGTLPTTPAVDTALPALPGAERADVPAPAGAISGLSGLSGLTGLTHVGTLPTVPSLPAASMPGLPKVPAAPAALPKVPALPNVPGVGTLSGSLPGLPGQSDERADVPTAGLPALPAVSSLPALPALPGTAALPQLPLVGTLPVNPPATTLPAAPANGVVPALPVQANLPVLNSVNTPALPAAQVPALAGMDSSPLSLFQKLLGKFGKLGK